MRFDTTPAMWYDFTVNLVTKGIPLPPVRETFSRVFMEDRIFHFVKKLLSKRTYMPVKPYMGKFSSLIDSFLADDVKNEANNRYHALCTQRSKLGYLGYTDFSDDAFLRTAEGYLLAVKDFFQYLFVISNEKYEGRCVEAVRQIVEYDIHEEPENKSEKGENRKKRVHVDICNPLILESMFLVHYQIRDFEKLFETEPYKNCVRLNYGGYHPMYLICREVLRSSAERLFRDIEILYGGEYYCVTDFDEETSQFIAVREDDLSSVEQFCSVRLFDKIVEEGRDGKAPRRSLIVGALRDGDDESLKSMIDIWRYERGEPESRMYDWITMKGDVISVLANSDKLLDFLKNHDRIFFLDCPGIYSKIYLKDMDDVNLVKNSRSDHLSDIIGIDSSKKIRCFNNSNQFCTTYYRVQNYLVEKVAVDVAKSRSLNIGVFDYLENLFERDETGRTMYPGLRDKEIYLYYSRPDAFPCNTYDMYDFCRFELHNSKMCRVVKFSSEEDGLKKTAGKTMKLTFFRILETLSCSGTFYCNMTGDDVCDTEPGCDRILNAVYIAQRTLIDMEYGQNADDEQRTNVFDLKVSVTYPRTDKDGEKISPERAQRYELMIKQTIYEGFRRLKNNKGVENLVLFDTYHGAFVNVLGSCAASFNDMLFYHLCKKLHEVGNVAFVIKKFAFRQSSDFADAGEYERECQSYSDKRLADEVMDTLDAFIYLDSDRHSLSHRAATNRQRLRGYIQGVMKSCEDVGYTDSILYSRLLTFFRQ